MGIAGSKLERVLGTPFPENERYLGLENFGNTCYCNSVLQALYFCLPFRKGCIQYLQTIRDASTKRSKDEDDHMLLCLCELFAQINSSKKRTGVLPPKKFVNKLRKENEVFRTLQHQDAHEFFNYLLNTINELWEKEMRPSLNKSDCKRSVEDAAKPNHGDPPNEATSLLRLDLAEGQSTDSVAERKTKSFVHDLFEGTLASDTRCLTCETVTSREEAFIDLSVDIEPNSSLYHCIRNFSSSETLSQEDKFFCNCCTSLQEAQKCIRIKKAPLVLAIHLKRFKYIEQLQRYKKLSYRVPFSMQLRLPMVGEEDESLYHLFAVIIHVGSGPNMGHYVSMIKSHGNWLLFDDDLVEHIPESYIQSVFGISQEYAGTTQTGYILFYSLNDCATKPDPSAPSARLHYASKAI